MVNIVAVFKSMKLMLVRLAGTEAHHNIAHLARFIHAVKAMHTGWQAG